MAAVTVSLASWTPATRIQEWSRACLSIGWPVLLLTLPVTTPAFLGCSSGQIRPPAAIFAFFMLPAALVLCWRSWLNDVPIRRLLVFVAFAVVVGAITVVGNPPWLPGKPTALMLYGKGLMALSAGVAIYLVARACIRTPEELLRSLLFLLIGLGLSVMMAVFQVLSFTELTGLRGLVVALSELICPLYNDPLLGGLPPHGGRGHGLAYEPSYLASQLTLLLLPLGWWALRVRAVVLGHLALAIAMLGIFFSGSRGGIVSGSVIFLMGAVWLSTYVGTWKHVILTVLLSGACAISGWLAVRGLPYMESSTEAVSQIFGHHPGDEVKGHSEQFILMLRLLEKTSLVPRASAGVAAFEVFVDHPLVGAGLGLAPLSMPAHFPVWSKHWSEMLRSNDAGEPFLVTPMAMVVRIPAEFGLVGLSLIGWFILGHRFFSRGASDPQSLLCAAVLLALTFDSLLVASFAMSAFALAVALLSAARQADEA